jgi:integrase
MGMTFREGFVKFGQIGSNIVPDCDQIEIRSNDEISMRKGKASKGTVVVRCVKGRLRLVWSFGGKRYFFALELTDSKTNRTIAELKAKQIERDIANDLFDPTLEKYRAAYQQRVLGTPAIEIFERFVVYKSKSVGRRTLEKYTFTLAHLRQFFRDEPASEVMCEQFKEWLAKRVAPITLKQRIGMLKSAWAWGIEKKLVQENPWTEAFRQVKVAPKQPPKPFTELERHSILAAFRQNQFYSYYTDYVDFLLSTGCRPGEVCALRWKHVADDCSVVWIGEAYSRGELKATKTGEARFLKLTPRLQNVLKMRRFQDASPEELVFPACEGGYIDDHNFRNRAWKSILRALKIEYRKPYNMRHTFASSALDMGLPPAVVASLTGHTVETLYRHYAGNIRGLVELPEL